MTNNPSASIGAPYSQPKSTALSEMQRTLLRKYFSSLSQAGADIRPLTKLLSTVCGSATEMRGYLAMLSDTLSKPQAASIQQRGMIQLSLAMDTLWEIESTLFEVLSYAETSAGEKPSVSTS